MGFIKDFKDFISKGNVIDLAVAVVIGGAFGKIINSLVADVIMPPIGQMLGGVDFNELKHILQEASATAAGEPVAEVAIRYGAFVMTIVEFIIIALSIFMIIRMLMKAQKAKEEAPAPPPAPTAEEVLLTEIRDVLKSRN